MDIFIGIFAIVVGLGSLWFSIKFLKLYFKVNSWERVEAKILKKEITLHEKYSTSRSPYKLNANYCYKINNEEFSAHFVYLADLMGGQANHMKSNAENQLEKIKETMIVFVNPKNPKEAVMFCDGAILYWVTLFMGLFALLFGVFKVV